MNTYCQTKISVSYKENTSKKLRSAFLLSATILLSAALIFNKTDVTAAVTSSAAICLKSLIPALYPFMVISGILTRAFPMGKRPLIFAFLVGNVCGFPLGAKLLSDLLASNEITKEQFRAYLPICCNPGLAFTVVGVGLNLWNSYAVGALIYAVTLLSAAITFLIIFGTERTLIAPRTQDLRSNAKASPPVESFGKVFSEALSAGTESMLKVCGSVIFFAVLSAMMTCFLDLLNISNVFSAFLYSFFEISGATSELASISSDLCLALTFFAHGFGGLCICAQITAVAKNADRHIKSYLLFKILQACICFLISFPIVILLFTTKKF